MNYITNVANIFPMNIYSIRDTEVNISMVFENLFSEKDNELFDHKFSKMILGCIVGNLDTDFNKEDVTFTFTDTGKVTTFENLSSECMDIYLRKIEKESSLFSRKYYVTEDTKRKVNNWINIRVETPSNKIMNFFIFYGVPVFMSHRRGSISEVELKGSKFENLLYIREVNDISMDSFVKSKLSHLFQNTIYTNFYPLIQDAV